MISIPSQRVNMLSIALVFLLLPALPEAFPFLFNAKPPDKVMLVIMDGFRWDYLDIMKKEGYATPTFDQLVANGTQAEYMQSVYPTVTFPNIWSLVTGMTPENHGIVNNEFYDPVLNASYDMDATPFSHFYNNGSEGAGAEPIWLTNQRQGHMTSVAVFPAGNVSLGGKQATFFQDVNYTTPWVDRVDFVVSHLTDEKQPANLALLYFEEPDEVAHEFSPDSRLIYDKIIELDGILAYLMDQLQLNQLADKVNIIITADHGMSTVVKGIDLDDYLDPALYSYHGSRTGPTLWPKQGQLEVVESALEAVPNITVWRKEELPKELHYTYNRRIAPLVLFVDEGVMVISSNQSYNLSHHLEILKGHHGYNASFVNMRPFFIAVGSAFKVGYRSKPVYNLDVYPLMCYLLGIDPYSKVDGNVDNIRHILKENDTIRKFVASWMGTPTLYFLMGLAVLVSILATACYFKICRRRRSLHTPVGLSNFSRPPLKPGQQGAGEEMQELLDQDSDNSE